MSGLPLTTSNNTGVLQTTGLKMWPEEGGEITEVEDQRMI